MKNRKYTKDQRIGAWICLLSYWSGCIVVGTWSWRASIVLALVPIVLYGLALITVDEDK